jgi:hypothetical protein
MFNTNNTLDGRSIYEVYTIITASRGLDHPIDRNVNVTEMIDIQNKHDNTVYSVRRGLTGVGSTGLTFAAAGGTHSRRRERALRQCSTLIRTVGLGLVEVLIVIVVDIHDSSM